MPNSQKLIPGSRPSAPSRRDLEIYKRVVILHQDRCHVCFSYNLKPPRISQIIAKVRRWLAAGGAASDPSIRDHFAQQHLSRAAQKMRLQGIIDRATHAMENQLPPQITTKARYHGMTEFWREETRHLSPPVNMPAMRLLLRAVKTLDDLEARYGEDGPAPKTEPLSEPELLQSVFELLCRWRTRAEAAGRLPQSPNIAKLIAEGLSNLIGAPLNTTGRPATLQASCLPTEVGQASCQPSDDSHAPKLSCPTEPTKKCDEFSATPDSPIAPTPDQPPTSTNDVPPLPKTF